jgi:3-oxoadipate enol-lactonase
VPRVRVGDTQLYFERHGSGEPLLWVTGLAISGAVFEPVLSHYTDRFECVVYDNRGAGRSAVPLWPTSMPQLAGDAVKLLDALGIDSAHVYGVSMGGMVAQEMALRFPERVRGLVLGGTSHGGPRAVRPALRELRVLAGNLSGLSGDRRARMVAAALFSPAFRREHPERVEELLRYFFSHRARTRGRMLHWWASLYHDTVAQLHRIAAPTLIFHGAEDRLVPPINAQLLAQRIPDAEVAMIGGAGHAYVWEEPEEARDRFLEWWERRRPIAPGPPLTGLSARTERLTRAIGLTTGAARAGRSMTHWLAGRAQRLSTPVGTTQGGGRGNTTGDDEGT